MKFEFCFPCKHLKCLLFLPGKVVLQFAANVEQMYETTDALFEEPLVSLGVSCDHFRHGIIWPYLGDEARLSVPHFY